MAYVSVVNFSGHRDSINSLAFSPDGCFLASGGDDCTLFILQPETGLEVHKLVGKSPVTSLCWGSRSEGRYHLFVGYASGQVWVATIDVEKGKFFGFNLPRVAEGFVQDIAFIPTAHDGCPRIAICAGPDVELWSQSTIPLEPPWRYYRTPFSKTFEGEILPRSVHATNGGSQIVVSYLSHGVHCWDLGTREVVWSLKLRCARVGSSCISANGDLLAVSNLYDGFDLYNLLDRTFVRTFRMQISENIPLPALIEGGVGEGELFAGSSCGEVRVFHMDHADDELVLSHPNKLVQALAYVEAGGLRLLAAGPSESGGDTWVKVWKKSSAKSQLQDPVDRPTELGSRPQAASSKAISRQPHTRLAASTAASPPTDARGVPNSIIFWPMRAFQIGLGPSNEATVYLVAALGVGVGLLLMQSCFGAGVPTFAVLGDAWLRTAVWASLVAAQRAVGLLEWYINCASSWALEKIAAEIAEVEL